MDKSFNIFMNISCWASKATSSFETYKHNIID